VSPRAAPERGPSRAQIAAAAGRRVPDVVAPSLSVLFVGINPGLYSAAVGHHFARPGNRFWPTLHGAGFTPRRLRPAEERGLLELGFGITNLVARATASADELTADELRAGGVRLRRTVCRLRPDVVAVLGVGAYRVAFEQRAAAVGPQPILLCGSRTWLLPNPSGLNAHYRPADLVREFTRLRRATGRR
jgi:TDG/mug DNA glycosylase family protein